MPETVKHEFLIKLQLVSRSCMKMVWRTVAKKCPEVLGPDIPPGEGLGRLCQTPLASRFKQPADGCVSA